MGTVAGFPARLPRVQFLVGLTSPPLGKSWASKLSAGATREKVSALSSGLQFPPSLGLSLPSVKGHLGGTDLD